MTNLYHFAGVGHFVLDYPQLLEGKVMTVIWPRCGRNWKPWTPAMPILEEKRRPPIQAMEIELKAACAYIRRYAQLAASRAEREQNPGGKQELLQIAENCNQIAGGPARTMWQAVQLWRFAYHH